MSNYLFEQDEKDGENCNPRPPNGPAEVKNKLLKNICQKLLGFLCGQKGPKTGRNTFKSDFRQENDDLASLAGKLREQVIL